jgi:hypothetical protein
MSVVKKHTSNTKKLKKKIPPVTVVTRSSFPVDQNPMPEKLKRAQEILGKTKFPD